MLDAGEAADESMRADANELMRRRAAANVGEVADLNMARQHHIVGQDDALPEPAVMTDMRVGEENTTRPHDCLSPSGFGPRIHGHAFANEAFLANDQPHRLAAVLQILRRMSDRGEGEDPRAGRRPRCRRRHSHARRGARRRQPSPSARYGRMARCQRPRQAERRPRRRRSNAPRRLRSNNGYYVNLLRSAYCLFELSGWNLVGNPYPSAIDLTVARDTNGFQNQVQVWKTTGPFAGSWQTELINGQSGSVVIPPFQAFMVRINPGSTGLHYYPFYQSERVRTTNSTFYRSQNVNSLLMVLYYGDVEDQTEIGFNPAGSDTFSNEYDANKPDGAQGRPTLYTDNNDDHWYAINTLPLLIQSATVPMGLKPGVTGTMTLSPEGVQSFDPTTYIYLEDKKTSTWQNLRNGTYTFSTNINDSQDRFVLHFTPPAEILTSDASCNASGMIHIIQPGTAIWNYQITDNNNNIISSGTLNANSPVSVNANTGIYQLKLWDNNGYTVLRNIQVSGSQPVVAAFTASTNVTQIQEAVTFTSTTWGGVLCNWDFGDGTTGTGQAVVHNYTNEGVYTVQLSVTNADGCSSNGISQITVTSRGATGVSNLASPGKINIWSSEDRVFVDFTKMASVDADIEIYNILGQLLSNEKFGKSNIYSKEIDNLEAAYLIIKVNNEGEISTRKVFIANVTR